MLISQIPYVSPTQPGGGGGGVGGVIDRCIIGFDSVFLRTEEKLKHWFDTQCISKEFEGWREGHI